MLSASRALALNAKAGPPLPRVDFLKGLYDIGCTPRKSEMIMVAGRPGHQKSALALAWADEMKLRTLYFSADMSAFQASVRLLCKRTGRTLEQAELGLRLGSEDVLRALDDSRIRFSFGKPITWASVNAELEADTELWNSAPELIVFDNLMDFEAGEADYGAQMEILQVIDALKSDTGATVMVLHHATDKGKLAMDRPDLPPPRWEIKGGLGEKPELTLGVAINPVNQLFSIAVLKQRMGPSDPSGALRAVLQAEPERTRFRYLPRGHHHG